MFKRPVLILFVIAALVGMVYGFTQGFQFGQSSDDSAPTSTDTKTVTPTRTTQVTPPNGNVQQSQQVQVYLVGLEDSGESGDEIGCGDSLIPVTREIPQTQAVLQAALSELFSLQDQYYGESGLYNALYNSDVQVDSAQVENGTATVNLSGKVSLGGVCDNPRVEGQIRATAEQFETVEQVDIFLNGEPLSEVLSGQ